MRKFYLSLLFLFLGTQLLFAQTTWYVTTSGSDASSGTSWSGAFRTLQKALSSADSSDAIWVATGTYYPDEGPGQVDNDRNANFSMKNGVAIYGGFLGTETTLAQRNWTMNVTTLSGDLLQNDGTNFTNYEDNAYHVVFNNNNGLDTTAILDGFTVKGGNPIELDHPNEYGGGLYNKSSSPLISNCIFSENRGSDLLNSAGTEPWPEIYSQPVIRSCHFFGGVRNFRTQTPSFYNCTFSANGIGGGMSNYISSVKVINCIFSGNSNGISISEANAVLENCSFSKNGVGVSGSDYGNVTLVNCMFSENTMAIRNELSLSVTLTNCIFWKNGFGVSTQYSSSNLINCTFSGNGGTISTYYATVNITNSILWNNKSGTGVGRRGRLVINNSIIEGGVIPPDPESSGSFSATNLMDIDPLFVDTVSGDLRLQPCSPALDTGINSANTTPTDLDGNPRIANSKIDLGAYEFQGTRQQPFWFYRDSDGDGYGDATKIQPSCTNSAPQGYVANSNDCDDNYATSNLPTPWYQDADGDGYAGQVKENCGIPAGTGWSRTQIPAGDCNDNDATVYPNALEICDGKDNNCNGTTDENKPTVSLGPDKTVYISPLGQLWDGYPRCVTLVANVSGETSGLVYEWSNGMTGQSISVCPTTSQTYTVTLRGCLSTAQVTVNVVDLRCGEKLDKVVVCHNGTTECVECTSVQGHLNHGDVLGACPLNVGPPSAAPATEPKAETFAIASYPNPFVKSTTIRYSVERASRISIKIYDQAGKEVSTIVNNDHKPGVYNITYNAGKLAAGHYYARIVALVDGKEINRTTKLIKIE